MLLSRTVESDPRRKRSREVESDRSEKESFDWRCVAARGGVDTAGDVIDVYLVPVVGFGVPSARRSHVAGEDLRKKQQVERKSCGNEQVTRGRNEPIASVDYKVDCESEL